MRMSPLPQISLRRWWITITVLLGGVLLLSWWLLGRVWPAHANLWLLAAALPALYMLVLFGSGLKHNHRQGESELLPTLGIGNHISLFRGLLLCLIAGFIAAPMPRGMLGWAPAILYTVAILLDLVDGYAARRTHHTTRLGEKLDIELDGMGVFVVILLSTRYGDLPVWFVLLAPLRPLFLLGMGWRARRGLRLHETHESSYRRLVAGMQMAFLSIVLWPIVGPPVTTLGAVFVATALLASFGRDWLVTIGTLDANSAHYWQRKEALKRLLIDWVPPMLRSLVLALVVAVTFFDGTNPGSAPGGLWVLMLAASAMVALGIVTRVGAVGLALMVALQAVQTEFSLAEGIVLASSLYLILSGGGRLALWEPERRFFTERLGAKGEVPGGQLR